MDRKTVGLVWVGGIVLMLVVYAVGAQHFLALCGQAIAAVTGWLDDLLGTLVVRAFELIRAAAIALYAVFVVLAVLSMRRGVRAGGMLVVVSVVFLLLVRTDWYAQSTTWLGAAVLLAVAAGVQTRRLIDAPRARDPTDPWGMTSRGSSRPPR